MSEKINQTESRQKNYVFYLTLFALASRSVVAIFEQFFLDIKMAG